MPELPEVETVKRGLEKHLIGHLIKRVKVLREKSFPNSATNATTVVEGAKVDQIKRRAKMLMISLSSMHTLLVHLKMTGQLVYRDKNDQFGAGHPNDSLVNDLPDNTTRVILELDDQARLYFNDQRVFGWIKIVPTADIDNLEVIKKLGPEPLEPAFTLKVFKNQLLMRKNSKIKAALLDQTVVAGIGNIYADEALWMAKIHPENYVRSVSDQKIKQLHKAIIEVLQLAIDSGGSTDRNYVDAEGRRGSYLKFAKVFRREGKDCPRCDRTLVKIKSAGRGTHLCTNCQRLRKENSR